MTITEYLEGRPKWALLVLGALLFLLVGAGDYLTHANYALEFSAFYLVPVSFFSWFIGKRAGIAFALASVGMGFLVRLRPALGSIAYWVALVWLALYVCSTLMIVQLKRLYEHERELSRIDPLTMAENRRALFEAATRARSFSDRHLLPLSIAYLDLDDFKQLNDRMGHSTGDKLLALAADCIRKALRPTDVVARLGGDEFALLLPQTDKETAASIVSRVRFELDRAMQEHHWPVTFSVGVVSFSPPIASVPQMIRAADEAMYAAKKRGKDRVEQREIGL